jgi:hypothetical protein
MKSPYKLEFYLVHGNKKVEALNFLQAAELFEAKYNEPSIELPGYHHEHIQLAECQFEQEFLATTTDSASGSTSDAVTNQVRKFLRERRAESTDEKFRESASRLIDLLEYGTISILPTELKKLQSKFDKNQLNKHQTESLIMRLAVKYTNRSGEEDDDQENNLLPPEIIQKPEIIISETFSLV